MTRKAFFVQLVLFVALLAAADLAADRIVQSRFVPLQTMKEALAAGDHCVTVMGASQMVAALDTQAFADAYAAIAPARCVANVAIGGTFVDAQVVAYQHYRTSGKRPAAVVLGFTAAGLLDDQAPEPDGLQGNMASVLYWSRTDDVTLEYPRGIRDADNRLRFLIRRSTTLTSLESIFWLRAQQWQAALKGDQAQERNRFGLVGDMRALAAATARDYPGRMESQHVFGGWREHRWLTRLKSDLAADGTPLLIVTLPTPPLVREAVEASPLSAPYQSWLAAQARSEGFTLLDLSRPAWLTGAMFMDDMHLNAEGAARFSKDLAAAVAELSRAPRR